MKALKIIILILAVIFMTVIVIGLFLPPIIEVERSITVNAEPNHIHPYIEDFRNWSKWSAWAKKDNSMTNIYEGPESGEGSVYRWAGDEEVGTGMLKMTRSDSSQGIWYDMFMEDGQMQSEGSIAYQPTGDSTEVTWTYRSDIGGNIIFKYVMVFFKPYIEHDFDEGLRGLKKLVESDSVTVEPDSALGRHDGKNGIMEN